MNLLHLLSRPDLHAPRMPTPPAIPGAIPGFIPGIRVSLEAKLERLLRRPVIAQLASPAALCPSDDVERADRDAPSAFLAICSAVAPPARRAPVWRTNEDGACVVPIALDYADLWRGAEKEVLEAVNGTIEQNVCYLTDLQRQLMERSPREFLRLHPPPESAELITFRRELVGGVEHVVELTLAEPPRSPEHIRHIAIVPNLIPLERQLEALDRLEQSRDDGPLGPLRVLVGLAPSRALCPVGAPTDAHTPGEDGLDDYQGACAQKALSTPHFAVIKGPPGSGKTTVISTIIQRALARGERVLVVSPTHVAVDNVVEKLAPRPDAADTLERRSLPVRFAARSKRLLGVAGTYWVGPRSQRRAGTLSRRLEARLRATLPLADALYRLVDPEAAGLAPLSRAIEGVQDVLCGTPIGILSFDALKNAEPGSFDLLVVDEVSKMTLPEFLAIAIKARRWVLVGDPEQLPPYCSAEENGCTLDDVLDPALELVCSVGAVLERVRPELRGAERLVVVCAAPTRIRAAVAAHLDAVDLGGAPPLTVLAEGGAPGLVFCTADEIDAAFALATPVAGRDWTHNSDLCGSVRVLVERGVRVPRPALASGSRLVEPRLRAPALLFDNAFSVYHAQPWARRADQRLAVVGFRNGLEKYLPSEAALIALGHPAEGAKAARDARIATIAERLAVNTVSVYDWLVGMPTGSFDVSPLRELEALGRPLAGLTAAVRPFVGTLRRQYRMHASLSQVPRALFYFGEALEDGPRIGQPGTGGAARGGERVRLVPVQSPRSGGEENAAEADAIGALLTRLGENAPTDRPTNILVITPYRAQERLLSRTMDALAATGTLDRLDVEVCTLDRCQGREAEYVFLSLVRNRSSVFLDNPKRWNVALTRAKEGLFIFGDVESYLREARDARARGTPPRMSLLARALESYDRQIKQLPPLPTRSH